MGLGSIFPDRIPLVNEAGAMTTTGDVTNIVTVDAGATYTTGGFLTTDDQVNLIHRAVITGDMSDGSYFNMTDSDIDTYVSWEGTSAGTRYITIDFGETKTDVLCGAYYLAKVFGNPATSRCTWQTSTNGSDWTDVDEEYRGSTGGSWGNWSEIVDSLRYLRFKIHTSNSSGKDAGGRIYHAKVTQR